MSGMSEERRKEIEALTYGALLNLTEGRGTSVVYDALRDLLAESAALRTTLDNARQEIQRLWTLGTKAESAALRAPASPDDLARVASIRERLAEVEAPLLRLRSWFDRAWPDYKKAYPDAAEMVDDEFRRLVTQALDALARIAPPTPLGGATALDSREAQLRAAAQRLLAAFDTDADTLEPARTGLGDYRWDRELDAALTELRTALAVAPASAVEAAPEGVVERVVEAARIVLSEADTFLTTEADGVGGARRESLNDALDTLEAALTALSWQHSPAPGGASAEPGGGAHKPLDLPAHREARIARAIAADDAECSINNFGGAPAAGEREVADVLVSRLHDVFYSNDFDLTAAETREYANGLIWKLHDVLRAPASPRSAAPEDK